jgi:alkanesulfonate monooxygenase SsuD/methylene tetrahydromethanopterin reductase-like flavin-dependent oxidoreductase (luciferase family)
MKFIMHVIPAVPGTPEERERMAPIGHSTERVQKMLDETVSLARLAEEMNFWAMTWSEHHFYTEGLEFGAGPIPHLVYLLSKTKRIKLGPVGFVLPTWDPIRLAEDVAWADHMSQGRVVVGLARGFFPRWVNVLGQRYGVEPGNIGPAAEEHNREVFEELFEVVKKAWKDEAFSHDGKYYKVPFPAEGHPWPAAEATRRYGAPGEVDEKGWIRKISVVPKPFQKPHPPLLQALTTNEATIRWAAREGIAPMVFLPFPDIAVQGAEFYREEAAKAGRDLARGQGVGLARLLAIGKTRAEAREAAENGSIFLYKNFHSKFYDKIPDNIQGFVDARVAFVGSVDDIRRDLDEVREKMNPEYFMMLIDQGFLPIGEVERQIELFGTKILPEFSK